MPRMRTAALILLAKIARGHAPRAGRRGRAAVPRPSPRPTAPDGRAAGGAALHHLRGHRRVRQVHAGAPAGRRPARRRARDVVLTREPGGSPGAEEIRAPAADRGHRTAGRRETEILLFTAARRDHLEKTVQPALDAGATVISRPLRRLHPRLPGRHARRPARAWSTGCTTLMIGTRARPDLHHRHGPRRPPCAAASPAAAARTGSRTWASASRKPLRHGFLALARADAGPLRRDRRQPRPEAVAAEIAVIAALAGSPTMAEPTLPEPDRIDGAPHPRETPQLFGQDAAERRRSSTPTAPGGCIPAG